MLSVHRTVLSFSPQKCVPVRQEFDPDLPGDIVTLSYSMA